MTMSSHNNFGSGLLQPQPQSPMSSNDGFAPSLQLSKNVVNHNIPFPWKLHELLDMAESDGFTNIVSWLPDQHSFRVHNVENFVNHVMKRFFKQTKYKSFQRQLNMWGFDRILSGPGKGGYSHTYFVRGKPSLCCQMTRLKVKGAAGNGSSPTAPSSPPPISSDLFRSSSSVLDSSSGAARGREAANGPDLFEPGTLEQVLQCGFDDGSGIGAGNSLAPAEGDSVLFEGRSFFLVDDYNPTPQRDGGNDTRASSLARASRRMSIEFRATGANADARRPRRRLSLLPSNVPSASSSFGAVGAGRSFTLEPAELSGRFGMFSSPSRKHSRRFSLERATSMGRMGGAKSDPSPSDYVLRRLPA